MPPPELAAGHLLVALRMEVRVATVLVPEMLQLPPRAQEQAPALSSEPQAAAAAAADSPLHPAGPLALLLLLLLLGGGQRPRGRPLPRGHPLNGLLHRQVLGVAPQVAREDVGRHGGGEGRGGIAAPEEPDLGSGARVDLMLAQGKERGRENEIVSSSIFFIFCASATPPTRKNKISKQRNSSPSARRPATAPRRSWARSGTRTRRASPGSAT